MHYASPDAALRQCRQCESGQRVGIPIEIPSLVSLEIHRATVTFRTCQDSFLFSTHPLSLLLDEFGDVEIPPLINFFQLNHGSASICHYTLSNFEVYGQLLPGLNHFSQVF